MPERVKCSLGDVGDVEAWCRKVVSSILDPQHPAFEDAVADAAEIVVAMHAKLEPGASLKRKLAKELEWRVQDRLRKNVWRQPQPAASAIGPGATSALWPGEPQDTARQAERLIVFDVFRGALDVRDPRIIGHLLGTPSYRPPGTAAAAELWADVKAEREEVYGWRDPVDAALDRKLGTGPPTD
jgi:hypothetical protein